MSIFDGEKLYIENHYDSPGYGDLNRDLNRNGTSVESVGIPAGWTRFLLTILLRIGFVLVQIGSVPVTNVNLILLQNVVDFSCVTLVYILAGYVIAYGPDVNGLMGQGNWVGHESSDKEEAIAGWQAIVIASAICTSCLVGRTHTVGYLFIGIIMAGVLQPFVIHWAWTNNGWMARNTLHEQTVNFRDHGGSAVVHIVGSLTGLMGCMILGRRILRLRDIDDASISPDSAGTAFAGYLLILVGLQSLCLPSTSLNNASLEGKQYQHQNISLVVVNNLLGASACSLVVVGLHFFLSREPFNHWTVMRCVQASIAGMTIVSAGVNVYTPILCVGLGCSGGIIFYLVSRIIFQSALEDYCNIIATHLTCALVGSFVVPFCRNSISAGYDIHTILLNVAWQLICLVAVVSLVTITMTIAFSLLECFGLLRNRSEFINHLRAVVALERGPPRSYMERLFFPDKETFYLQPATAPVQRLGNSISQRYIQYERASIDKKKSVDFNRPNQHSLESEVVVLNSKPSVVLPARVKKFRQVHTISSMSEVNVSKVRGHKEAMGDNQLRQVDDIKADDNPAEQSKIQCSGDFANQYKSDESLVGKFADVDSVKLEDTNQISLERKQEPYKLHRTEKFMNLRLDAITEYNENIEFLVKPRPRNFSSTESESDDDIGNIIECQKFPKHLSKSITRIPECSDINL